MKSSFQRPYPSLDPFQSIQNDSTNDPIAYFNMLKDLYSGLIETLTSLKKQLFAPQAVETLGMDQHQRSKLRISIESLLIDLNEEIFSISEELTKSITKGFNATYLDEGIRVEFEQRKRQLIRKIKDNIDDNPSVKLIRRSLRIQQNSGSQSPPQRDTQKQTNERERTTIDRDLPRQVHIAASKQSSKRTSPINQQPQLRKNMSLQKLNEGGPHQSTKKGHQQSIKHQLSRKKSPIPLRRKDPSVNRSFQHQNSASRNRSNTSRLNQQSAKKQLMFKTIDNGRTEQRRSGQSKLDEFEKFLAQKNQSQEDKENQQDNRSVITIDGIQDFAKDFNLMKNKILHLQQALTLNEDKTMNLERQVEKLRTENLKLSTDIKIIRNEHSEILHKIVNLDKKNGDLVHENNYLKKLLGYESVKDMPRQVDDTAKEDSQERRKSPFNSFLHKDRSQSNEGRQNSISQRKVFQIQKPQHEGNNLNAEFLSFQPSLNQTYKDQSDTHRHDLGHQPNSFHNPILSVSNDRIVRQSFNMPQTATHQRMTSGNFRGRDLRIQDTPTTPDNIVVVMTDDTPNNIRQSTERTNEYDVQSRSKYQMINKRITPSSSNQMIPLSNDDINGLSDWVLERMRQK